MSLLAYSNNKQPKEQKVYGVPSAFSIFKKILKIILPAAHWLNHHVFPKLQKRAADGKRYNTSYYNLDAIIAVGYRVNSKTATMFRIWSNRVLK